MKKSLAAILAAITFGGAVAATAAPAEARDYRGRYDHRYDRHRGNDAEVAIAAGVVGLALGAALASDGGRGYRGSYYDRGYGRSYYGHGYQSYSYYDDYPRYRHRHRAPICEQRRWVWDPYIGRRVMVRERYRC